MLIEQRIAWREAGWIFGLSRLTIVVFSYLGVAFLRVRNPGHLASSYIVLKTCSSHLTCFLLELVALGCYSLCGNCLLRVCSSCISLGLFSTFPNVDTCPRNALRRIDYG